MLAKQQRLKKTKEQAFSCYSDLTFDNWHVMKFITPSGTAELEAVVMIVCMRYS